MNDRDLAANLDGFFGELEKRVGLPKNRFQKLYALDDDWSLVVRVSAMIEAALNQALSGIKPSAVAEWIARRSLSEKLTLLQNIGFVQADMARAIRAVAQIRNAAV